jgi:hypothetical protein
MPSFRSAASQAKHFVIKKTSHGTSRHALKVSKTNAITSIGTESKYYGNIKRFIEWLLENKFDPKHITEDIAYGFLELKSSSVAQKTLDGYRQAIQMVFEIQLPYVASSRPTILLPRAYTLQQINLMAQNGTDDLGLSIRIAVHAGLRAHELDTICRVTDMKEDNRDWLNDRFRGKEEEISYVVKGKGGLRRTIRLTADLCSELERRRLPEPVIKRQRGINYKSV